MKIPDLRREKRCKIATNGEVGLRRRRNCEDGRVIGLFRWLLLDVAFKDTPKSCTEDVGAWLAVPVVSHGDGFSRLPHDLVGTASHAPTSSVQLLGVSSKVDLRRLKPQQLGAKPAFAGWTQATQVAFASSCRGFSLRNCKQLRSHAVGAAQLPHRLQLPLALLAVTAAQTAQSQTLTRPKPAAPPISAPQFKTPRTPTSRPLSITATQIGQQLLAPLPPASATPTPRPPADFPPPNPGFTTGVTPLPAPIAAPTPSPAPTPVATQVFQSPVTSPNTDAPDLPPAPGLPAENIGASANPAAQNPQFRNPNEIVPMAPITPVGAPAPADQIASSTPNGPPIPAATPAPIATPTPIPPENVIASGDEGDAGELSLEGVFVSDLERGLTVSRSPVTLRYREFVARGDRGLFDSNTDLATLSGNLTVTVRGQIFTGRSLVFNTQTGKWTLSNLQTTFPPDLFAPGTVLEPVYLRNGTVVGDFDNIGGQDFRLSTCNLDHYHIQSKQLQFYRNRAGDPSRLVLRRNAVYLFGKKVLPLPLFVVSLLGTSTRDSSLRATFGQNAVDGFFARSLYDLRSNPGVSESILIDTLQKRGLGLGFQRQYAATAGILYLYGLNGRNGEREVNSRLDRTYKLTDLITSNIRFDSSQITSPSGLSTAGTAQTSTTRNGTFTFTRAGEQSQTGATLGFNNSSYGFGESKNGSIALNHRQDFGSGYSLEATSLLSRSMTGASQGFAGSDSATSDNTLVIGKTAKAFDAFLRADTHDDLVNNRSYNLERVPELTLQSSTARLPIPGLKEVLPGSFTLALGRYNEPSSQQQKERADLFYTPDSRDYRLLGQGRSQSRLGFSGNFEQAFYSDDTARYNYAYNLVSSSTAGPAQLQINYAKQATRGFTPFQFDFFTPGEYIDYNFSVQTGDKFRLNLTGGRDIQNDFTRDAILRVQFSPTPRIYTSLGTSYRLQPDQPGAMPTSRFGEVYANVRLNRNRNRFGGGALAFGVRYSPQMGDITRANGSVDINLGRRTRIQGLAGYDGFTKKFDFTQVRLTRDLHCFNLFTTYDGQRKELRFDLALKAFPFTDTRFGRNQTQEGFDSTVGDIQ